MSLEAGLFSASKNVPDAFSRFFALSLFVLLSRKSSFPRLISIWEELSYKLLVKLQAKNRFISRVSGPIVNTVRQGPLSAPILNTFSLCLFHNTSHFFPLFIQHYFSLFPFVYSKALLLIKSKKKLPLAVRS